MDPAHPGGDEGQLLDLLTELSDLGAEAADPALEDGVPGFQTLHRIGARGTHGLRTRGSVDRGIGTLHERAARRGALGRSRR